MIFVGELLRFNQFHVLVCDFDLLVYLVSNCLNRLYGQVMCLISSSCILIQFVELENDIESPTLLFEGLVNQ